MCEQFVEIGGRRPLAGHPGLVIRSGEDGGPRPEEERRREGESRRRISRRELRSDGARRGEGRRHGTSLPL